MPRRYTEQQIAQRKADLDTVRSELARARERANEANENLNYWLDREYASCLRYNAAINNDWYPVWP